MTQTTDNPSRAQPRHPFRGWGALLVSIAALTGCTVYEPVSPPGYYACVPINQGPMGAPGTVPPDATAATVPPQTLPAPNGAAPAPACPGGTGLVYISTPAAVYAPPPGYTYVSSPYYYPAPVYAYPPVSVGIGLGFGYYGHGYYGHRHWR